MGGLKPDFGLKLKADGFAEVPHSFYRVQVSHLSVSGGGLYTFTINRMYGGSEYVMSLDFDATMLAQLLALAPDRTVALRSTITSAKPGQTIEIGPPIVADIEARVGTVQNTSGETFAPLNVCRVAVLAEAPPSPSRPTRRESRFGQFMRDAGDRPYRELVEHHLRKESTEQLRIASLGEISRLAAHLRDRAVVFIDAVNAAVGYSKAFWASATCRDAFDTFVEIARDVFGDTNVPESDEELSFILLQLPTLSFAYSASDQREQREFMGIRTG